VEQDAHMFSGVSTIDSMMSFLARDVCLSEVRRA